MVIGKRNEYLLLIYRKAPLSYRRVDFKEVPRETKTRVYGSLCYRNSTPVRDLPLSASINENA